MYALLGEKFVKIFAENWNSISMSYDIFLRDPQEIRQHKIILDGSNVDFSLEPLHNCNMLDAYSALKCQQKASSAAENISLLPHLPHLNIFKKSDFFIQKSVLKCDFLEKIAANTVFIMENIIAAFCHSVTEICEKTWWMYVADHHCSGIRIVAGIGDGIVLSRVLSDTLAQNVSDSLEYTIKYLKRFGLKNTIKIIGALDNIFLENQEIIRIKDDAETMLLKFLATTPNIRPARSGRNYYRRMLQSSHRKILILLGTSIFMEIVWLAYGFFNLWREKQIIAALAKTPAKIVRDASSSFQFKITRENFSSIEQLAKILKNASHPAHIFRAAAAVIRKNKIAVEQIVLENNNSLKIKTTLNKSQWHRMLKSNPEGLSISLERNFRSEFDRLDSGDSSDEKIGALICIKMK
ncbi:MAG: hypothetical protein LBT70_04980 [Holosporaceae bacterium]|nr:hypothetical protein [Holosporaceae bacterium]